MSDFAGWESRYAQPDYWFGTAPNAFLASQRHRLQAGWRALAVADGEGRNGVWLAQQGLAVTSIDVSPRALAKAKALAARHGVTLDTQQADLTAWAWPENAYDLVAVIFIQFCDPPQRAQIFAGITQALKPGGLLLMHGYRPEQIGRGTGGPPSPERCYTRAFLQRTFGAFRSLAIREHESVLAEGQGHIGLSALIDVVAVK